jgi:hypothetical protein
MKTALFLLICASVANAKIIRLSLVVPQADAGVSRFEIKHSDNTEAIFVQDKAIITEEDIANAIPSPSNLDSVDITLSAEGTEKIIAATSLMRPSIDRIAIIVDGEILSTPVVQSVPLGKNFVITGLDEENEPAKLAARLMGKTVKEIENALSKEKERLKNLPPRPEPVYHSEEEYKSLKQERAKIGLHYMDRVYTEAELDGLLKKGMKEAEVIAIFGKARSIKINKDGSRELLFETAPEKFPTKPELRMNSFGADFVSGELTEWNSATWSARVREPKNPARKPSHLIIKTPPADMSSEDFDFIAFYEKHEISLKPGEKQPTKADYYHLLGILHALSSYPADVATIDSKSDLVSILVVVIPELAKVSKTAEGGEIPLAGLKNVIEPYLYGEKTFE